MTLLRYRPLTFTMFDELLEALATGSRMAPMPEATDDGYTISLPVPGVPPESIDLTVEGHALSVTVDERSDHDREDGSYHGAVAGKRTFRWMLPEGIDPDGIKATCEHGMLRISVPRVESAKARRIELTAPASPKQVGPGSDVAGGTTEERAHA